MSNNLTEIFIVFGKSDDNELDALVCSLDKNILSERFEETKDNLFYDYRNFRTMKVSVPYTTSQLNNFLENDIIDLTKNPDVKVTRGQNDSSKDS